MKRQTILLAVLLTLSACTETELQTERNEMEKFSAGSSENAVPGRIRVKFDHELDNIGVLTRSSELPSLESFTIVRTFPYAGKFEERHREAGLHLWYDLVFDDNIPLTKAEREICALDGVEYVEPVWEAKSCSAFAFNDPLFSRQWHYFNAGDTGDSKEGKVAGSDINLIPAWEITTGSPNVIVAVNDHSSQYDHEDLAANMWINEAERNGQDGVDDDGNGYIDDIYGYNFMTYNGTTPYGKLIPGDHGTHIAGTIAAVNNNGVGVCGIAGGDGSPGSGVRIMNAQASGGAAFIDASIAYAADMGAVLMNCSWSIDGYSQSLSEAIDYFNKYAGIDTSGNQVGPMAGGLAIFAAGNESASEGYPAQQDNVFSVAAIGADYVRAYYTNYGEWVDISAPGGDAKKGFQIYSTVIKDGGDYTSNYGSMQGTSMAAPHVTGVAALVVSKFGGQGFTRDKLIAILKRTADKKMFEYNTGYETRLGAGLVDAFAAVSYDNSAPEAVTDLSGNAVGNSISLSWKVPGSSGDVLPFRYNLFYSLNSLENIDVANPSSDVNKVVITMDEKDFGDVISTTLDKLEFSSSYHFRLNAEGVLGAVSPLSDELVISTLENSKPVIKALDGVSLDLKSHESAQLRFEISDADGQPLTFSVTEGLDGLGYSRSGNLITLSVNALKAVEGQTYKGVLSVTDSYETTDAVFTYTIRDNHNPSVTRQIDNTVLNGRGKTADFQLTDYFDDSDGEILTYAAQLSTTSLVVKHSISGDVLTISANSFGTTKMTVTATDARGGVATQEFEVLVRDGSKEIDLYPNPVTDLLNIRVGYEANNVSVKLISASGSTYYSAALGESSPFKPASIRMSDAPAGQYTVFVTVDDKEYKSFIVKL